MKLNAFRSGWMSVVLIAAGIPLGAIAWGLGSTLSDFIAALALQIYAVVLMVSLVCNLAIVLGWRRDRPVLHVSPVGLPLAQVVLLLLEIIWICAIVVSDVPVVFASAIMIACVSVAVFVLAVAPDADAYGRLLDRRSLARSTPRPSQTA